MANDYRNESTRSAPSQRYGVPGTTYPTPNPFDELITETGRSRAGIYYPIAYGTPHQENPLALLCFEGTVKSNNTDKDPQRIYANTRFGQAVYNTTSAGDANQNSAFPWVIRSYLLLRDYVHGTIGAPLDEVVSLEITNGGQGYGALLNPTDYNGQPFNGQLSLSFSEGTGGGAEGVAEVQDGVIVAVILTNGGSYTAAPNVSVNDIGTGVPVIAEITANLQPQTMVLTEESEAPAEHPYTSLWVRVTRKYETLPGPIITTEEYDAETNSVVTVTRQEVATNTTDPTLGSLLTDFKSVPISAAKKMFVLRNYNNSVLSTTILEYRPERFVYPALLTAVATAILKRKDNTTVPFVNLTIEAERPRLVPHEYSTTFTTTQPTKTSVMSGIQLINPQRLNYNGVHFSAVTGPLLTDGGSIVYTTGTDDPEWTFQVETYTYQASTPSRTSYIASRTSGAWYLIDRQSKKLARSLWSTTSISIPVL